MGLHQSYIAFESARLVEDADLTLQAASRRGELALAGFIAPRASLARLMEVRGWGMARSGLRPGDQVVVDSRIAPRAGVIVAALIDGALTLRRLARDAAGGLLLRNEGAEAFEARPLDDSVRIEGVVTAFHPQARRLH